MFDFEEREDGFLVVDESGYARAHVITREIGETNDPRLRKQERTEKPLDPKSWVIHFTGRRFTLEELTTFCNELAEKVPQDAQS